jgi:hypothetical protein
VRSPSWAADYAERQASARLQREEQFNRVIERRCPGMKPTPHYLQGPLPPSRFYTRLDHLNYSVKRAMGKFNPNVRY